MSQSKSSVKIIVNYAIMIALILCIRNIAPPEPMTVKGMQLFALLIGLIYGWGTIGMIGPSLLGMFILGFTDGLTVATALQASIGNTIVAFMLLSFLLIKLSEIEGVPKFILDKMLGMKLLKGRPMLFSGTILVVAIIIGIINIFLSILFLWSVIYGLSEEYGYDNHEAYPILMNLGIVLFSTMGIIALPFQDNGLIIMSAYTNFMGESMNYFHYLGAMLPIIFALLVIWLLVSKYILKADFSKLENIDKTGLTVKANKRQKATLVLLALFITALLLQANIPATSIVGKFTAQCTVFGPILLVFLIGTVWYVDGKPMMDFKELSSGILWDTWIMCGMVMALSGMLTAPDTGISAFCVQLLTPLLGGVSPYIFVVVIVLFALAMTNICNNIVVTLCLIPVVISMSSVVGIDVEPVVILLILAAHFAFLTPAASSAATVLFSNEKQLPKKLIYKYVPMQIVICVTFILTIGYVWVNLIF